MITIRKLKSLPESTRLRKAVRLLDGFVQYRSLPDSRYLAELVDVIREAAPGVVVPEALDLRAVDTLRHALRARLAIPAGDWDLLPPAGYGPPPGTSHDAPTDEGIIDTGGRIGLYLESIRSPFNVGSIVRTAAALGVRRIGMSPDCPPVDHPRLVRSARGALGCVEIMRMPLTELGEGWLPLLALELGGEPVDGFSFPVTGTLLLGSEELGLSGEALSLASSRVSIPMAGPKGSLNVGVACGIALHAWNVTSRVSD